MASSPTFSHAGVLPTISAGTLNLLKDFEQLRYVDLEELGTEGFMTSEEDRE